jgi:membrane protein
MLKQISSKIQDLPQVRRLITHTKTKSLPGFQGVPMMNVWKMVQTELFSAQLSMKANAIAYSFFMSLFPALIVLISIIPFVPFERKMMMKEVNIFIDEVMPSNAGSTISREIDQFLHSKRKDFISVGFILALFFSTNGVLALMNIFQKASSVFIKMGYFEKRFRAIGMTAMMGTLLVTSFVLVILGNQMVKWAIKLFKLGKGAALLFLLLRWIIVVMLFYIAISMIYRFGVATLKHLPFFSAGATFATILSLLTSVGFSFYVDNFGNYNKIYGSIGSIIVLLVWLQLNAMILILGFELNAGIMINKYMLSENEVDRTPPV